MKRKDQMDCPTPLTCMEPKTYTPTNPSKNLTFAFNNKILSDLLLHIKKKSNPTLEVTIYISKLHLAAKSEYFRNLFLECPSIDQPEYDLEIEEDVKASHIVDLIRCMYKQPLLTPTEDLMSVITLADKYGVETAIKSCAKDLGKQEMTLVKAVTFLQIPGHIKENYFVKEFLVKPSSEFILQRFSRVRDLFRSEDFLDLPFEAVMVIIQSDNLLVDSENSVFYFIMVWIFKDIKQREQYFQHFLPHIRFPQMQKYFLLDIVPQIEENYFKDTPKFTTHENINPSIRQLIQEARELSLEKHVGNHQRLLRNHMSLNTTTNPHPTKFKGLLSFFQEMKYDFTKWFTPRTTLLDPARFTIKCIFKEVNRWDLYGRYYSDPVFAHGYEFYFFLRKQYIGVSPEQKPGNPEDYTLAGFLRCTSRLMQSKHFLPICSSVAILLKNNQERRFTSSKVIFEASEKAIGGKLTLPGENWAKIISGDSPLVVDNTLSVLVTVDFLESDESCQVIEGATLE